MVAGQGVLSASFVVAGTDVALTVSSVITVKVIEALLAAAGRVHLVLLNGRAKVGGINLGLGLQDLAHEGGGSELWRRLGEETGVVVAVVVVVVTGIVPT